MLCTIYHIIANVAKATFNGKKKSNNFGCAILALGNLSMAALFGCVWWGCLLHALLNSYFSYPFDIL